jgi:Zn-dependent peptidase ImmA (M78 family)
MPRARIKQGKTVALKFLGTKTDRETLAALADHWQVSAAAALRRCLYETCTRTFVQETIDELGREGKK